MKNQDVKEFYQGGSLLFVRQEGSKERLGMSERCRWRSGVDPDALFWHAQTMDSGHSAEQARRQKVRSNLSRSAVCGAVASAVAPKGER